MRFIEFLLEQAPDDQEGAAELKVVDPDKTPQQQARQQQQVAAGNKAAIQRQMKLVQQQMREDPASRRVLMAKLEKLKQQMNEPEVAM